LALVPLFNLKFLKTTPRQLLQEFQIGGTSRAILFKDQCYSGHSTDAIGGSMITINRAGDHDPHPHL
jgi:hypothetical protein